MEGVNVLHDQSAASLTPAQGLHDDQSDFIQSSPQSQLTSGNKNILLRSQS